MRLLLLRNGNRNMWLAMKVVDEQSAYLRLKPGEYDPERMYKLLKGVLGANREPHES